METISEKVMTILFAGTGDGRTLAEILHRHGVPLHICVATDYGEKILEPELAARTTAGRMNREEMAELFREKGAKRVIDATHPYAVAVTENIRKACEDTGLPYLRLLRQPAADEAGEGRDCIRTGSIEEAVEQLKTLPGNILVTTGSKELKAFTALDDYKERCYVRVLPSPEVLKNCISLGFPQKHILAMQGPFSEEMNTATLRQCEASWLVTKESGKEGGYPEKVRGAERAGAGLIVIRRPVEGEGYTLDSLVREICPEALNEVLEPETIPVDPRRITLLGTGMGSENQLTYEGIRACREADVIIGSKRMLSVLRIFEKPVYESWRPFDILSYIHKHPEYHRIVVAYSGDIGFYSGARKLYEGLAPEKTEWICGISSVQYFCSRIQVPWEDVHMMSVHGRDANLAAAIREHRKVFSLIGGEEAMRKVCRGLIDAGMGNVSLWVGQNLSYPDEIIWQGTVLELSEREYSGLNVVLFENPDAEKYVVTHGIPDSEFVREKIPMTKEEIRAVSLSKLRLTRNSVIYDIGAGTGSVSIEAARQAADGFVLAIDRSPHAVELIRRNARKFGVTNIEIIAGDAPEALADLPKPTHAFIGGSSGNLKAICDMLRMKNPGIRIVVNAVTLETISALTDYLNERAPLHTDVVYLTAARTEKLGSHHLMKAQNPVVIAAFDDNDENG